MKFNQPVTAGNSGPKVKSDCCVTMELTKSGGIDISLNSKVELYYGDSIRELILDILSYFGIKNAVITMEDTGALPFAIAARVSACVKQLIDTNKEYLPEFLETNRYSTAKDRFRLTRLYLPGNNPYLMINAGLHKPDGVILDLEDAVAPSKKTEARFIVRNALRSVDFYGAERMVRINQGERGLVDLKYIVPNNVNLILLPKVESAEQVIKVDKEIKKLKKQCSVTNDIHLMPIIESALGVECAYEIAKSSPNIVAMAIGLEDYTADIGVGRTQEGNESLYARNRIVNACKAASIQAIDSVFSDIDNMDALAKTVKESRAMGFVGMGCIHPRQIKVIAENFKPTEGELEKSLKVVEAFEEAQAKGLGVVALGSKMIDPPVVKRHLKRVALARKLGMID